MFIVYIAVIILLAGLALVFSLYVIVLYETKNLNVKKKTTKKDYPTITCGLKLYHKNFIQEQNILVYHTPSCTSHILPS